jgi:hypothetical protein
MNEIEQFQKRSNLTEHRIYIHSFVEEISLITGTLF